MLDALMKGREGTVLEIIDDPYVPIHVLLDIPVLGSRDVWFSPTEIEVV